MNSKPPTPVYSEYNNFAFHPYNVMLVLLLMAITALFLGTSAAFIYTRVTNGVEAVKIPWLFAFNTLVLLGSSYSMKQAKKAYLNDQTKTYQSCLLATIGLTFIFLFLQLAAWSQLFSVNIFLASNNAASYLYMLSGLHFAHVLAGLPFLGLFLWKSKKQMIDPVTVLVYFSDPEKRLRLRLLSIYWHYLDALWIFLVLFLFANQLI
jgi:cytochrome c oxidase subunit 3